MNIGLSVASFVAMFMAMIGITVVLRHRKLMSQSSMGLLSFLLMNVLCPALIFSSMAQSRFDSSDLLAAMTMIGSEVVIGVLAYAIGRWVLRLERVSLGTFAIATMFGSSGLIGNALVKVLFHDNPVIISMSMIVGSFGNGIPGNTIGILIAMYFGTQSTGKSPFNTVKKFMVEPCMLSLYAGLAWSAMHLPTKGVLIETVFGTCTLLGAALPLCSAMLIGLSLEKIQIGKDAKVIVAGIILALLIEPLLVSWFLHAFTVDTNTRLITILFAAMPASPIGVVLANRYGCDTPLASKLVTATLIASAFTLPLAALF
jgi:predicted permease